MTIKVAAVVNPLREDVLALFLDSKGRGAGEEWEDTFAWS
jgi:hypothetical protein